MIQTPSSPSSTVNRSSAFNIMKSIAADKTGSTPTLVLKAETPREALVEVKREIGMRKTDPLTEKTMRQAGFLAIWFEGRLIFPRRKKRPSKMRARLRRQKARAFRFARLHAEAEN